MRYRNTETPPPKDASYLEWLRYLVQSSEPTAGELPFLVGLWNDCIRSGGLTPAQQRALDPYMREGAAFIEEYLNKNYDLSNVVMLFDDAQGDQNG